MQDDVRAQGRLSRKSGKIIRSGIDKCHLSIAIDCFAPLQQYSVFLTYFAYSFPII
jgi:hypothetical protein